MLNVRSAHVISADILIDVSLYSFSLTKINKLSNKTTIIVLVGIIIIRVMMYFK